MYTNGFDITKVMTALFGRVGWIQPIISGSPVLNTENKVAKGGRYYQDFHAMVSVNNIRSTMEEPGANDSAVNAHLEQLQKAAIMRCLNAVFREKEQLEQAVVFDRFANSQSRAIENKGLFVGYEIKIANAVDISVQLEGVTLSFDAAKTFNLYLFAEGIKAPIKTIPATVVANDTVYVSFDEVVLNYLGSVSKARRFYLGYFQDDLGDAKAILEDVSFKSTNCFKATPFSSRAIDVNFDRSQISCTNIPYGINIDVSCFRDHTQQIVKNAPLFDEVIGLSVVNSVLEHILSTTSSNATERVLRDAIDKAGLQQELRGAAPIPDTPKIKGLNSRLDEELERLRDTFFHKTKSQVVNHAHY